MGRDLKSSQKIKGITNSRAKVQKNETDRDSQLYIRSSDSIFYVSIFKKLHAKLLRDKNND